MKIKFGDIVQDVKCNIDRENNPFEFYVAGDHLDSEDLTIRRRGRFSTDDVGPAFVRKFTAGQILYGSRRTYLKKVAVADFDGICANTTFVFESKNPSLFDQRLLPFLMLSDNFTKWSISHSKGSTNPYILFSDLAEFEFDLPPLKEQKKLADKLWAAYRLKESYKKLLASMDELAKSRFIGMFGTVEKVPLEQLATIVMGQSPTSDSYNTEGLGVPFYQGSSEFTDKYVGDGMFCTAPTRMAKAGDVLMSVRAPVGAVNITLKDCCIGRGLAAIRSKVSAEYNEFFLYAFRTMTNVLDSMGHGSTVLAINKNNLHGLMMPNPSLSEQMSFVTFVQQLDKSKLELQKSIAAIDDVIKSLIN